MKMKTFIAAITITAIFSSCEKGTDVRCKVQNSTGEQMTVHTYYKYKSVGVDTTVIQAGATEDVFISLGNIGSFQSNLQINSVIDSITAVTASGKTLSKKYDQPVDWSREVEKKNELFTFSTTVNNSDLKK